MSMSHRAPPSFAVSGFIWERVVRPAQRQWHFFQDVLSGAATPCVKALTTVNTSLQGAILSQGILQSH